jgi:predicted TIM-barrel fold metal-dependent hydrolase
MATAQKKDIYNCHAHCFTIFHVPDFFARRLFFLYRLIPVSWIIDHSFVRKAVKWLKYKWLHKILGMDEDAAKRISLFADFFDERIDSQEKTINYLQSFYPKGTKLVLLTMDMQYMSAGNARIDYAAQLNELSSLKNKPQYKDIIYPFVFADPRRANITGIVINALETGGFQGIKLYPALGYYPFDERLKDIYIYARDHQIPIITHCIKGTVFFRGSKKEAFNDATVHPVSKKPLFGAKAKDYTLNFTHPLNYECLLNHNILKTIWGDDAPDLSTLKICLGHYGGDDEWMKYLCDPWMPNSYVSGGSFTPLNIAHPWFDPDHSGKLDDRAYSWFSVCNELIAKYDNIYADISYILSNPEIYPMLKMIMTMPYYEEVSKKVLFGTDYFVVAKEGSDREMSIKVRAFLGEELFFKMSNENAQHFLFGNAPAAKIKDHLLPAEKLTREDLV